VCSTSKQSLGATSSEDVLESLECDMKPIDINLPTFGFVVMTRALLGMGIGLLVAGRLTDEQRRAVGLTLVAVGAATTVPAALAVFGARTQKAIAA
jgi:hypothetical protein